MVPLEMLEASWEPWIYQQSYKVATIWVTWKPILLLEELRVKLLKKIKCSIAIQQESSRKLLVA